MEGFSWVLLQLKQDYVDPTRVAPDKMLARVLEYIERRVSEVEIDLNETAAHVQVGSKAADFKVGKPGTVWEMNYNLQPIFQFIGANLDPSTDPKDVEFAAINGMLATLDPHSNLLPPELFREMQLKTTGEFGGLGIRITIRKGALTIISPLPDTPAARLGLKAMDQIVRIGDQSTVNMALDEAVNFLRGKPGSKVTIWVKRAGWTEAHKYVITRETIRVRSIISKLLADQVGYIQIQDFSRHTGGDLLRHLSELKREARGLKGLILDLRNNAGGLMKAAVQVADLFLDRGIIVATVAYGEDSTPESRLQKSREEQRAREDGVETDLPIVVLVNSGSASASEILAGALKNLDRAVLMGEQTFGKGTVQILNDRVPPSIEGACLKLTVAEYLIPGDISIQEVGVTPDIKLVPMILDKDDLQLFAQPERFREEDIPSHLKTQNGKISLKPAFEVRYMFDAPKRNDEDEEPPLEEPGFQEDYQIRLAREYLLKASSARGAAMLDEGAGFLQEVQARELKNMAEAMRGLSVDWSTGAGEGAQAEVGFSLQGEGVDAQGHAQADSKVRMKLSVRNTGSAPYFRLRAESRSPIGLFDRREFLFGRLDPGQTKSWEVPIKVPRGVSTRRDEIRFEFTSEGGSAPAKLNTQVGTNGLERPSFGFSYRVLDPDGNGDGLIQAGEKIQLELSVHNMGNGKSFDAKALLKNESGKDLFLEAGGGRIKFDQIEKGATKTGAFRFHVREDSSRTELPVELTIWDATMSASEVAYLQMPVHPRRAKPAAVKTGLKVRTGRAVVRGGADVSAPLLEIGRAHV
jgi:carboxyl-terminal processing protease